MLGSQPDRVAARPARILDFRKEWAAYQKKSISAQAMVSILGALLRNRNCVLSGFEGAFAIAKAIETNKDTASVVEAFVRWCDFHGVTIIDQDRR